MLTISVFDAETVVDVVGYYPDTLFTHEKLFMSGVLYISVNDTESETDVPSISVIGGTLSISVSDTESETESVQFQVVNFISVNDVDTDTDVPNIDLTMEVNVFDTDTDTDSPNIEQVYIISVSDTDSDTDVISTLNIPLPVSTFDTDSDTDVINLDIVNTISVNDVDVDTDNYTRTNYELDPSFASSGPWQVGTATGSGGTATCPSTDRALYGTTSGKLVNTAGNTSFYTHQFTGLTPLTTYTFSVYYYISALTSGSIHLSAKSNDFTQTYGTSVSTNVQNAWTQLSVTFTLPSGQTTLQTICDAGGFVGTVYFDGALLEISPVLLPYFDGSFSGASWTGSANNSSSTIPWWAGNIQEVDILSVSDTDTDTDSPNVAVVTTINVSDTDTDTDVIPSPFVVTLPVSVFDTETETESITMNTQVKFSVFDTDTDTDAPFIAIADTISVYDLPPGVDNGLTAWWLLNEGTGSTAYDTSGNSNNGTLVNSPTWVNNASPINGQAIVFSGSNYVSTSLAFPSSGTMAGWVYPTAYANFAVIFGWKNAATGAYVLLDNGGAGSPGTWRSVFNATAAGESDYTSGAITQNVWQHVAMTWSLSGTTWTTALYVNGVLQGNNTQTGTALALSTFAIGTGGTSATNDWTGRESNVRVYNRALSQAEITALANSSGAFDTASILEVENINVFDTETETENVQMNMQVQINVFDAETVTDAINFNEVLIDSVFDQENETDALCYYVDTLYVLETVYIELVNTINVFDTETETEFIQLTGSFQLSVFDTETESESVSIVLPAFTISVEDADFDTDSGYVFENQLLFNSVTPINGDGSGSGQRLAQSFKHNANATLLFIDVSLSKSGSPTDLVTINIVSALDGTVLGSTSINSSLLTTLPTVYSLSLSNPVLIQAGTTYYIEFVRAATDAVNVPEVSYNSSNPYPNGSAWMRNSGTWSQISTNSFYFSVYNNNPLIYTSENISVFDADTVTEAVTMVLPPFTLSVSDTETETEFVDIVQTNAIAVTDSEVSTIAFDAAGAWTEGASVSSITWNHTVGSGANMMLFVLSLTTNNDASATYNSVAMTKVLTETGNDGRYISLFALAGPVSGTNAIVVSTTASEAVVQGGSASYSGVAQTVNFDATTVNTTGSTGVNSLTTTITPTQNNAWAILGARTTGGGIAAGTNSTFRSDSPFTALADTNGVVSGGVPVSMTANTTGGASPMYAVMLAINPATSLTESVTIKEQTTLSVFDAEVVTDVPQIVITKLFLSVFDADSATELVTILEPTFFISVFDTETVTDVPVIQDVQLFLNVFDAEAITENVALMIESFDYINVFDQETLDEFLTIGIQAFTISVFDADTVTDVLFIEEISSFIRVSDQEVITESVSMFLLTIYQINVFDNEVVIDIPVFDEEINYIFVYDQETITEFVSITFPRVVGTFILQLSFPPNIILNDTQKFNIVLTP